MEHNKHFESFDLWLCSYLICEHDAQLLDCHAVDHNARRCVFEITPYPSPESLALFNSGQATANILNLRSTLTRLRRALDDASVKGGA